MENLKVFFQQYSPEQRVFGPELRALFDRSFHPDVIFIIDGQHYDYNYMLHQVTQIFAHGSRIQNLQMKPPPENEHQFEYSMSYSQQDEDGVHHQYHLHSIASIKDNQVYRVEPVKESIAMSYQDIFDHNNNYNKQ